MGVPSRTDAPNAGPDQNFDDFQIILFGSAAGWHPDLAAEISGASLRLLHDGISQLIAEFATPAPAPADIMACWTTRSLPAR